MQRIKTLLDKISELSKKGNEVDVIEIDLMLDYTKVLYADILEWKSKIAFTDSLISTTPTSTHQPPIEEPQAKSPIVQEESITNKQPVVAETVVTTPMTKETGSNQDDKPKYTDHISERKNISKHIGINDKYQYISELFGNDKDRYDEVLNKINSFDESTTAINWLKTEIRVEQNWSDDIESVQMFYDTVNSFFSSK